MQQAINTQAFLADLQACTRSRDLKRGRQLHAELIECGSDSSVYVASTLVNMYARCGSMQHAHRVFDSIKQRNVVAWNVLILGYADNGKGVTGLRLFQRMRAEGLAANSVTIVAALKACSSPTLQGESDRWGKQIHQIAIEHGSGSNMYVQSALIDMYAKNGSMVDARRVFDTMKHPNSVSWNALILGYAENGQGFTALELFKRMASKGTSPDCITFIAALKACRALAASRPELIARTRTVHNLCVEKGRDADVYVQSTLIDMYSKCCSMVNAQQVFDGMRNANVVSWTALILGYAENGQGLTSLDLFSRMKTFGLAPDSVTFTAALKACGLVGGLEFGRKIHSDIDRGDFDVVLVTCLVDFYAKCGSLAEAQSVFNLHTGARNTLTWTALLGGFSSCGDHTSVFELFERMQDAGLLPDSVTFQCILTCCSHAGLIEKAKECFDTMSTKYGIAPSVEHYSCMVDILGRANKLDDTMALLTSMPCSPKDATWKSVLGACCKWKNLAIGRLAFQSLVDRDAACYVLMGQIYGSLGMLQEQEMVMTLHCTPRLFSG